MHSWLYLLLIGLALQLEWDDTALEIEALKAEAKRQAKEESLYKHSPEEEEHLQNMQEQVRRQFDQMDLDNNGYLTYQEILLILK